MRCQPQWTCAGKKQNMRKPTHQSIRGEEEEASTPDFSQHTKKENKRKSVKRRKRKKLKGKTKKKKWKGSGDTGQLDKIKNKAQHHDKQSTTDSQRKAGRPGGISGYRRAWYRSVAWVRIPPSAHSYKFVGTFLALKLTCGKSERLATIDEKSTSSGIAKPYARWKLKARSGGGGDTCDHGLSRS